MTQSGPVMDRDRDLNGSSVGGDAIATDARRVEIAERDVRRALRGQIARLERESSAIVADTFPHIPATGFRRSSPTSSSALREQAVAGPRLLTLAELERVRDRLAGHTQDLRRIAAERAQHEHRARGLLEAMKLEPGRHKFVRLPVRDLGEGGCGVWEVRPRLGLIGMLAGWWQVTLSSGCP
ncbi:MAG: hypothetical protein ACRDK7_14715 [Solirubrobacteraceae bacterium]